jgi:cellobiose phosphorylase
MRDCCQDAFGVIPLSPELARKNLCRIGSFFFNDGQAAGGCNRIGLKEGPSAKVDLPLWFVIAVADYLRETGDTAFLDERLPLIDGGDSTVYDKMIIGIERMLRQRGPHGLPLIGKGDWNDAANALGVLGKGESVWLAEFLCYVIAEIAPLMIIKNDQARLASYKERADELKEIINSQCWDGEWFVRAFRDDGRPLGVKGEKEGFIWINSQTWAVIAGIAEPGRLHACLDSVEKYMGTPYGLTNLAPAYSKYDPTIGLITGFRPGWKENGAVFSHASSFNVVARAVIGRGRDAVDLFRRILPSSKPAHYLVEPYVYSQFCAGPDAGQSYGEGAYHWLTGTAAWMFRAMTDYIIGVRPELNGLRIQPAVDPEWKRFAMKRVFRGASYQIEFENPDGVETGVRQIYLDGAQIEGTLLPLPMLKEHKVRVVMG